MGRCSPRPISAPAGSEIPMNNLSRTEWEILNATADDCENLEQIYRQVSCEIVETCPNRSGASPDYRKLLGSPLLGQIAEGIRRLVEAGLLAAEGDEDGRPTETPNDLSYVWRAWFRMTPQGRRAWESAPFQDQTEQEELHEHPRRQVHPRPLPGPRQGRAPSTRIQCRDYGTQVVGGVMPGKGGTQQGRLPPLQHRRRGGREPPAPTPP